MGHQAELAGQLRVTVEFTSTTTRSPTITWSPADAIAARSRFEYARIFLVAPGDPQRTYLDIVDGKPSATVRLPDTVPPGEYVIEVDAYGSASWGDGRLEARGRSAPFPIGDTGPAL
ncbi:hypothetical protein [Nocardia sp. XZ_19_385]|uniref:hypothetical protein n=1 Tax=Nocardia sp. XZ_19_385 TaxID=2769488 RepID=UPI00188FC772|nr:hypothetical protein [Nocardia sp. XZ_19_385]